MMNPEAVHQAKRDLLRLAEQLGKQAQPGHCDYISKADASVTLAQIVINLEDATGVYRH